MKDKTVEIVPEVFSVSYRPYKKDGYVNALRAIGDKIQPLIHNQHLQYVIFPRRMFDVIERRWLYVLIAMDIRFLESRDANDW